MAGKLKLTGEIAKIALKMLLETAKALEMHKVKYILEGGTLLGIIRENRLLPWDNDLDLTVPGSDLEKLLKARKELWKKGFRTRIRYFKEDIGPFKKGEVKIMKVQTRKFFFLKGFTLLDIFVKKKVDDNYFWTVGGKNIVLKSAPAEFYEDLQEVEFNGHSYSIPAKVEDYLSYRYGKWQEAQKEWNYKKDDNAIVNKGK